VAALLRRRTQQCATEYAHMCIGRACCITVLAVYCSIVCGGHQQVGCVVLCVGCVEVISGCLCCAAAVAEELSMQEEGR
jgi:hypothetical protein